MTVTPLLGLNTAAAPTTLKPGQWRYLLNAYQAKIGSSGQRPGSAPVTTTALGAAIERLTLFRNGSTDKLLATSGTSLYKYATGALTALTGTLESAAITDVNFTDGSSNSRKIIADGGDLKEYNDSTETVSAIVPAADDVSPAPPNVLATLNGRDPVYVWSYSGHIFIAFAQSDEVWYSKRYTYDYFPSVQYERWVKENDYVNGQGIAFDNCMLIPMRRSWGVLVGSTFDDFIGNQFLNTINGVIAPRSIQRITYPGGTQTIVYLSDDGVYEIYDTGYQDTGSRRYSTRSLMTDKVDFDAIGFTDAEKKAAVGFFDAKLNLYLLKINRGSERLVYAYDCRNMEWYPWNNIKANAFERVDDTLYYAGETGHLHEFDEELAQDYNESNKTTGTPIDWDNVTDAIMLEDSGYSSVLDYLVVFAKQFETPSTMDITIRTFSTTVEMKEAMKNQTMVWGGAEWGVAAWYNIDLSDLVGRPKRISFKKRSPFFQIRFRNNRGEKCELHQFKLIGRANG
jgi:hypothetical protein